MIIRFSDKLHRRVHSVLQTNRRELLGFLCWSLAVYAMVHELNWSGLVVPLMPVSILGGGLAIFLGFRNNSAYDRWWEARKIWGGVVNTSRTFAARVLSFTEDADAPHAALGQTVVRRHLAYLHALRLQLRGQTDWEALRPYLDEQEFQGLDSAKNRATMLTFQQSKDIQKLKVAGVLDAFEHTQLSENLERFYDLQGMSERIQKTVFPYFYTYFTRLFLHLFLFVLPLALASRMDWHVVPLSTAVSFVYMILDKVGHVTEEPFKPRSSGTPLSAICRVIEIDILQMLGETELPPPFEVKLTRHGAEFID